MAELTLEQKITSFAHLKKPPFEAKPYLVFVNELAPRLSLKTLSQTILEAFATPDVKAERIVNALKLNPYYLQLFERVLKFRSKRKEFASLDSGVVLLGMQNSRNLILALQSYRSSHLAHPELDASGETKFDPTQKLYFALRCEDWVNSIPIKERPITPDVAFAAGMIFDMLHWISEDWITPILGKNDRESDEFKEHHRKFRTYIQQVFTHSLQSAAIGFELMKRVPDFSYKKLVIPACLLHDIGKVAFAMIDPTYVKFQDGIKKLQTGRPLRFFAENQQYGVNHAVLSVMACHGFKVFRQMEKAILHHHHPHLLKGEKNHFLLASIISVASNMASHFRPVVAGDALVQEWLGLELKGGALVPDSVVAEVSMKVTLPA
ncbi:MAG: HDOD domain-containing protein [Bdellovibrionales bacterium]|nr:HDOD domain-containing protein [Bdellovibrionales bacterium]